MDTGRDTGRGYARPADGGRSAEAGTEAAAAAVVVAVEPSPAVAGSDATANAGGSPIVSTVIWVNSRTAGGWWAGACGVASDSIRFNNISTAVWPISISGIFNVATGNAGLANSLAENVISDRSRGSSSP